MTLVEQVADSFHGLARNDAFSGAVRVRRGGALLYEAAFGLASRAWGVPMAPDIRFDTASITKLFTVAAVLQQVDAGRLSLELPVIEYLGLVDTTISDQVTLFHLLTHSSGIGDDADEEAGEAYEELWRTRPNYSIDTTADLLPQFIHKPPNFLPGAGCRYNNVGYILAGLCVEKATGRAYRDYVMENVFARAGMSRAGFFRMDRVEPRVAEGLEPVVDPAGATVGWRRNIYAYPPIGSPDGGAYATVADLTAFMDAARGGRLFSSAQVEEFFRPVVFHSRREDQIRRYGLGLEFVFDRDDRLLYFQKDGINVGTSGILRHYPEADITVALLSNTSTGVWEPARRLNALILDRG